jgi:hypothetical protein
MPAKMALVIWERKWRISPPPLRFRFPDIGELLNMAGAEGPAIDSIAFSESGRSKRNRLVA